MLCAAGNGILHAPRGRPCHNVLSAALVCTAAAAAAAVLYEMKTNFLRITLFSYFLFSLFFFSFQENARPGSFLEEREREPSRDALRAEGPHFSRPIASVARKVAVLEGGEWVALRCALGHRATRRPGCCRGWEKRDLTNSGRPPRVWGLLVDVKRDAPAASPFALGEKHGGPLSHAAAAASVARRCKLVNGPARP